jgi:transposase
VCLLVEGGTRRGLTVAKANDLLAAVSIDGPVTVERVATARQLVAEIVALDDARKQNRRRTAIAVTATNTSLTDIHGIGPVTAAIILGRVGDVRRFPTAGHFARHNGTAPIEASSGPKQRHRLNPHGDRQLNHAIHMAAVTQVGHDTPGRVYYLRKQAEGKSRKEAMRCLKRRISDAVYQRLMTDVRG